MKKIKELIVALEGKMIGGKPALAQIHRKVNQQNLDKAVKYIQLVRERKGIGSKELRKELYGEGPKAQDSYKKLEQRLLQRLCSLVLLIHENDYLKKASTKREFECLQGGVLLKKLFYNGAYQSALQVARLNYKKSMENQLYEQALPFCAVLIKIYGRKGMSKEVRFFKEQYEWCAGLSIAEKESETLFHELNALIQKSTVANQKSLKLSTGAKAKITQLKLKHSTPVIQLYFYRITATYLELRNNFEELLRHCKQWVKYLIEMNEEGYEAQLREPILHQMNCYICIGKPEEAILLAQSKAAFFRPGFDNWFVLKELHFLALMHLARFDEAFKIMEEASIHERFSDQEVSVQARWQVCKAYFGEVSPERAKGEYLLYSDNKLSDLFSQLYFKDKKGLNSSFVIMRVFHFIRVGDYLQAIAVAEQAKKYAFRHLRGKELQRSRIFIKLLITAASVEFQVEKVQEKCRKILTALSTAYQSQKAVVDGMEILPFEKLWDMILGYLYDGPKWIVERK